MRKMFLLLFAIAFVSSCVSSGVREQVELDLNGTIGRLPSETFFHDSPRFKCSSTNGESGCILASDSGCTIGFAIDSVSGRISGWKYISRPEKCWGFHGA